MGTPFSFLKKYQWEILGALLLFWVVLINIFPSKHILLGGDVVQTINLSENFTRLHYDTLGSASLYSIIFYFLDRIGISNTAQLSWYLGIFLLGSYASFLVFSSVLFPHSLKIIRVAVALFYATNLYTLYIFTAAWGYSSYQVIYIFIPLLTGLYMKSLAGKGYGYICLFWFSSFLASMSFANPAFALALGIYFFLLTIILLLTQYISFDRIFMQRGMLLLGGAVLLNLYWILPQIPQLRGGVESVYTSEFVNLSERLRETSNAIFDTLRLMTTSEQDRYFPINFPYPSISWLKHPLALLAPLPFFFVLLGYFRKKEEDEKKIYITFFFLFVVFLALVARVRFPFETMNNFLFTLPGMNTLRGYDKLATFVPFILSTLLFLVLLSFSKEKKLLRLLLSFFLIVALLLSLPFYLGGLQTKLSYILSAQKSKDYTKARYSALVEVPPAYFESKSIIEDAPEEYKIAMLPFSPGSSVGRVNLPDWKVNGPDISYRLYNKQYIELYGSYVPKWKFAEDFEKNLSPEWIVDLYGLLGVKYILYHKDARKERIEAMEKARLYLENTGALVKKVENKYFYLYEIEKKRTLPYLYTGYDIPYVKLTAEELPIVVDMLRKKISPLPYDRKNPKEVSVSVNILKEGTTIFLNERYDLLWRARYVREDEDLSLVRDESIKYANAWKIDTDLSGGKVEIYYLPVKLFQIGEWISGTTLTFVILGVFFTRKRKANQ